MLVSPQKHKPFKLYLLADERAIGSALIQEFEGKKELSILWAEGCWMLKPGILPLRDYVFTYIFPVLSLDIIYYRLSVFLWAKMT